MRIALVEDNQEQRAELSRVVTEGFKDSQVAITQLKMFESGTRFLQSFHDGEFDLIIFDILMNGLSGIECARSVRETDKDVRIAFCTSSNDFAAEAFGVNACHYILKPVTEEKIRELVIRLNLQELIRNRYLVLPDAQRILLRSIIYIECSDHLLYFYLTSGTVLRSRLQQKKLEELLSPFPEFYPCAKGVIVNFNQVEHRTDNIFTMKNGTVLPISRRRIKETVAAFENHLFEVLRQEAK